MTSRIPGFYRLDPDERLAALSERDALSDERVARYREEGLSLQEADLMVENVISTFALPNAVAVNFRINGDDQFVPMVVEEPSVVAAVSNMARLARNAAKHGGTDGFEADADPGVMIGQIQLLDVTDVDATVSAIEAHRDELVTLASGIHPRLVERGGGLRDLNVRHLRYEEPGYPSEDMVVVHFHLDCMDAMGANMVNTVAERLAAPLEEITGCRVALRILSNLADQRLARARVVVPASAFGEHGDQVAADIASAWRFAWADPYRAATHNKGVMNGIDAVCLATGNDWRAVEAGVHAYAARDGQYRPVTTWRYADGLLTGTIEVPLQLGVVGGPIKVHPTVQDNLAMMGVTTARQLSAITAAVGLAQNMGALKALATEGIQAGHMRMHARTIAATAGAQPVEIPEVIDGLCGSGEFSVERARKLLVQIRGNR